MDPEAPPLCPPGADSRRSLISNPERSKRISASVRLTLRLFLLLLFRVFNLFVRSGSASADLPSPQSGVFRL